MIEKKDIRLDGLHCSDCVGKIERAMSSVPGVHHIELSFTTGRMKIEYDPNRISLKEIQSKIKDLGYGILEEEMREERVFSLKNREFVFASISGVALFAGLSISLLTSDPMILEFRHRILLSELFYAVAMIFGGYHVAQRGVKALFSKTFLIDSLIIIAAIGAALIDALPEGAAILFLFSMAELLEDYSVERSRRSLSELIDLTPKVASVQKGSEYIEIPIEEIRVGDIIRVRPGERIGVDGKVIEGHSSVNQAPITGESIPVNKSIGDLVFAGTINQEGRLEIEALKEAKDSTLARIVELVESAEEKRAPIERFIDRFARYYTPAVVAVALGVAIVPTLFFALPFDVWFYKALLLLVVSCPCALALSTPVSMVSGITSGARNGVLFKGGVYVEKLAKINAFAFDKTGTLTEGRPVVMDIIPFNDYSRKDILTIASSLESLSQHPLGKAIVDLAEEEGIATKCVDEFTSIPGKGVKGRIGNENYLVGSRKLFNKESLVALEKIFTKLEKEAKTIVIVGKKNEVAGVIGISDRIREDSKGMIENLRRMGVKRTIMITGDNKRTAKVVSSRIGVDEFYSELLPEEKVSIIKKIGGGKGKVAMVGDGVNDAPALAAADLGIAMGVAGSDTALEVADIALMNDDLAKVPYLLSLGKKTMNVVKQNVIISIGVKLLFAILVFPGLVTLWMAVAIGDMGVSLGVILNAMRLSLVGRNRRE